ncbi:MAG: OsmC family protein [Pseudomonadales bacterium]|jgi:putative redox protein
MATTATVKWMDGMAMVAESGSGHGFIMDGAPANGGRNAGARPMEVVLMGLGGCTTFDVMSILKKTRQQVTDCVVELQGERADAVPSVYTSIHVHFKVYGINLDDAKVERAVKLSAEKYCSASLMLSQGNVEITHSFETLPAESRHQD